MRRSGGELVSTGRAGLYVALLGHVRLEYDGEPFAFAAPRKTLPILAYLLVHRAAAISRDFLAFTMWPDAGEEVARGNLRRNLTLFKSILPPAQAPDGWILATNEFVQWNPAPQCTLDVAEFDRLCADDQTLEVAVELYGGDLLEDLYDDWVYGERERLRGAYLAGLKRLTERFRSDRDFPRALGYAQRLLALDPLREDIAREIAAIRYQSGDRAGALHGIDAFVSRLRSELGIEAMPETNVLRDSILRGGPVGASALTIPAAAGGRALPVRAELPFVGRETPMERAIFFWDRAARGSGNVTFIAGEAGIGKTRFVAEFASRVEDQGGRVLVGSTSGPEAFAYQGFIEALRAAVPLILASNLERVWRDVLATVVPELVPRDEPERLAPLRPNEDKTRLFESIARALRAIARTRPLLLVLEDMHWCGMATAELLRFVANRVASERIAVVITQRSEDVIRSHPLRPVRRELEAGGTNATIELLRLDASAVARIVESMAEKTGSRIVGRGLEMYETSLGNPLFLGELIGSIVEQPAGDSDRAPGTAPATISAAILGRLARLGEAAGHALEVAAVAGDTFDFELLGEVTGWESSVLLDALDALIERNILRATTRRERGAYAFTHHLIRRTAYDVIPPDRRRRYHAIAARAVAAMYGAHAGEWASDLARHHEGAGERLAAASAWCRAAAAALTAYANEEAVRDATRGLQLYADAKSSELQPYADLLLTRIDANDRLGAREGQAADIASLAQFARLRGDRELLRQTLRRDIELAQGIGEHARAADAIAELEREICPEDAIWRAESLRAQARLAADRFELERALKCARGAIVLYRSQDEWHGEFDALIIAIDARTKHNRYEENRPDLDRAAELVREKQDPAMQARLLQLMIVEQTLKQDFQAAYRMASELLELARATGNRLGEGRALEARAGAASRQFMVGEALEGFAAARLIYDSIGTQGGVRSIENNMATLDLVIGYIERGRERLTRMLADATAADDQRMRYFAESNLGVAAYAAGDYLAAKAHELRALALARRLGSEGFAALVLGDLGVAERELGDLEAARVYLEEAVSIHLRLEQRLELQWNRSRLALLCALRGEVERARTMAMEVAAYERANPHLVEDPAETLWNAAQALHLCGDRDAADELARRAATLHADRLAALDRDEYRESMLGLRWYRALARALSSGRWPDDHEDVAATPL